MNYKLKGIKIDTVERIKFWVYQCYYPLYTFNVLVDGRGEMYLQATYNEADIKTGDIETQHTRRWFLSPEMTKSEVVATCFKCIITSMEHRTREHFTYRGERIYGPHFDVEALHSIAHKTDSRK